MPSKTKKNKKKHNKTSKRVLAMWKDPTSVWGKNKPLETFWRGLAAGNYVVVIYKNGKHKYIKLPNSNTKLQSLYNDFDFNPDIEAVLSSNLSQDAYELILYPKAKDKTVDYVIKNYKKFFTLFLIKNAHIYYNIYMYIYIYIYYIIMDKYSFDFNPKDCNKIYF